MKYIIYALEGCPYSQAALKLLKERKLPYRHIPVDQHSKEQIKRQTGMSTFPQIYYEIGGFSDLKKLLQGGNMAS